MNSTLVVIDEENEKENLNETIDLTDDDLQIESNVGSNTKDESKLNIVTAENLSLPTSAHLMSWLNKIGKNVSNAPMVLNLVSKLKALVKEIDHDFTEINFDIDSSLSTSSILEREGVDADLNASTSSNISGANDENGLNEFSN